MHKERNLLTHAPKHLHDEIKADFSDMMYAEDAETVRKKHKAFLAKWRLRCRGVVDSLEEAGKRLFTFLRYPPEQWKSFGFVLAPCRAGEQQLSPDPVKFGQTEPVLVLFRHDHPFFERAQTLLYLPAFSAHLAKPCIKQWQRILGPGGAHAGDALAQFRDL